MKLTTDQRRLADAVSEATNFTITTEATEDGQIFWLLDPYGDPYGESFEEWSDLEDFVLSEDSVRELYDLALSPL